GARGLASSLGSYGRCARRGRCSAGASELYRARFLPREDSGCTFCTNGAAGNLLRSHVKRWGGFQGVRGGEERSAETISRPAGGSTGIIAGNRRRSRVSGH